MYVIIQKYFMQSEVRLRVGGRGGKKLSVSVVTICRYSDLASYAEKYYNISRVPANLRTQYKFSMEDHLEAEDIWQKFAEN